MGETLDLREARAETFEQVIGSEFRNREPEAALVLGKVVRHDVQPHGPRKEPFSLIFRGPPGLGQGIYGLDHEALGRLNVFLVPIGPGSDGQSRYEAVFN